MASKQLWGGGANRENNQIEQYIIYVRPLLRPTCDYILVNRNGKQFQKLTDLFSVLAFEAIGKYIHPTRYRQIIETQSCETLPPKEQKWISEDQKHSSNVARVHYQKKRSRVIAMRGRQCMQKLVTLQCEIPDNAKGINEESEGVGAGGEQEDAPKTIPVPLANDQCKRGVGIRFTPEEDNCIKLGMKKFGLRWSQILKHPDFTFNACRVPNTLRKRAEPLKLV